MHVAPLAHRLFCLALLLVAAGIPARQAAAAQADTALSPRVIETAEQQGTLAGLAQRYPAFAEALKDLAATARAKGSVEVVVKLAVPFAPETLLGEGEKALQRQDITRAAQALRAALPQARSFEVIDNLPYVQIGVDAAGLATLANVPGLTRIATPDTFNWARDFVELRSHLGGPYGKAAPSPSSGGLVTVTPQVIGGSDADPGTHPFQVALLHRKTRSYASFMCGGTLVAERFVVTAAHCSDFTTPDSVAVMVGSQRLFGPAAKYVAVKRIYVHPRWRSWEGSRFWNMDYDVAVWELAERVTGIAFATLPAAAPSLAGTPLRATGWGVVGWENPDTPIDTRDLQQIDLPFVPIANGRCENITPDVWPLTQRMICAGGIAGKDTCFGDSGGPLTIDRGAGYTELVGITSFGIPDTCAGAGYPGVYTNVADPSIADFITTTMKKGDQIIGFESAYNFVTEKGKVVKLPPWGSQDRANLPPGSAWLKVVRGSADVAASVAYTTVEGTARAGQDFQATQGVLNFAPGQTVGWIGVPIVDDTAKEPKESFTVKLSRPSRGWAIDARMTTVFIRDDDRKATSTAAAN